MSNNNGEKIEINFSLVLINIVPTSVNTLEMKRGLIHEFGHSLGLGHASSIDCSVNRYQGGFTLFRTGSDYHNPKAQEAIQIGSSCIFYEYGNYSDYMGMGFPAFSPDYNGYFKKVMGWIGDGSLGNVLTINTQNPVGEYTLNRYDKEGYVSVWLPFADNTGNFRDNINYMLEYRGESKEDIQLKMDKNTTDNEWDGLLINFEDNFDQKKIDRTAFSHKALNFLPRFTDDKGDKQKLLGLGIIFNKFVDATNSILIKVKNIDNDRQTLTFAIIPCDLKNKSTLLFIPSRAGNGLMASVNIFESDLPRKKNQFNTPFTIQEKFVLENISNCFDKSYTLFLTKMMIQQGNLYITRPTFSLPFDDDVVFQTTANHSFITIVTVNNPHLPDTQFTIPIEEKLPDADTITKGLSYVFHVVPTPDENNNDLEPMMIDIDMKDKDINNKQFNHLEAEKGQTLVFTSKIANNSRNPDGNKSSDFRVKWYIEDDKGNNIPIKVKSGETDETRKPNQFHVGILPKSIDNANPAMFTWTIPQDMKTGDYKVIFEVDWNNKLKHEFNEDNNMIWRYIRIED